MFLNAMSEVSTLYIGRNMDDRDDERTTDDAKSVTSKGIFEIFR